MRKSEARMTEAKMIAAKMMTSARITAAQRGNAPHLLFRSFAMIRWFTLGSFVCFLMAAGPTDLFAQFNPYGNRANPYAPSGNDGADPRIRRAHREQAVAAVGPGARDFVETQGDEAVAAIFACSKPVAVKLAEFHACGELGKLPRPRDLLRVIAQPRHGDDVAVWAICHARELADTDSFDAFLFNPLEYALGLKQLATGAAEARARRLNQAAMTTPQPVDERLVIGGGLCLLVVVVLVLFRRRQASAW
jgi:hypothetical protein